MSNIEDFVLVLMKLLPERDALVRDHVPHCSPASSRMGSDYRPAKETSPLLLGESSKQATNNRLFSVPQSTWASSHQVSVQFVYFEVYVSQSLQHCQK